MVFFPVAITDHLLSGIALSDKNIVTELLVCVFRDSMLVNGTRYSMLISPVTFPTISFLLFFNLLDPYLSVYHFFIQSV